MLERMNKEAGLGTALGALGRGAQTLGRSTYHAARTGVQDAALKRAVGGGLGESLRTGAQAAGQRFAQEGGAGILQRHKGKFLAGGLGAAGATGYALSPSSQPQPRRGREVYASEQAPTVQIEKFMAPEAATTLKTAGLHRIVAAMEKVAHGRDVGPELTLPIATQLLGERFFQKRAEYRQIQTGLAALRALQGE